MSIKKSLFISLAIIYGLFSSSTPDKLGVAEVAIGFCLIGLIGVRGVSSALVFNANKRVNFILFLRISLLYFLLVSSLYGLLRGDVSIADWIRDIIPLFYMFLIVLMLPYVRRQPNDWLNIISRMLVFIGCAFSLRFFMIEDVSVVNLGAQIMFGDMNYFPMDPAVTFGAVFALLEAFRAFENRSPVMAVVWGLVSLFCVASLAAMLVRAPLLLYVAVLLARCIVLRRRGWAGVSVRVSLLFVLVAIASIAIPILVLVMEKFAEVGLNTKDAEIREIVRFITSGLEPFLFGTGLGGYFMSPAYGVPVRFVHNLPGYLLLKGGVFGLLIGLGIALKLYGLVLLRWLGSCLGSRAPTMTKSSVLGASLVVFSSSFFLQPNFKSLSFGLVLGVVMIALGMFDRLPRVRGSQAASNTSNVSQAI